VPGNLSKYNQPWGKSYSDTTCSDFLVTMTEHEQWAAAADMLCGATYPRATASAAMPSDELVTTFRQGVETACVIDTMSLADVGATLYLTERARFGAA
jgi:hypothetical protein